jgi:hypothetical protein
MLKNAPPCFKPFRQKIGFEVLTAVTRKMAVFWVVAPCSPCRLHHQGNEIDLMMEAARTSGTSVNFYQTTRRYNPEDSQLRQKMFLIGLVSLQNLLMTTPFCTFRFFLCFSFSLVSNKMIMTYSGVSENQRPSSSASRSLGTKHHRFG